MIATKMVLQKTISFSFKTVAYISFEISVEVDESQTIFVLRDKPISVSFKTVACTTLVPVLEVSERWMYFQLECLH